MTFAESLRKIRQKRMLSQSQFAKIISVHQPTISRLEKESYSPRFSTAMKIARKLNVKIRIDGDSFVLYE